MQRINIVFHLRTLTAPSFRLFFYLQLLSIQLILFLFFFFISPGAQLSTRTLLILQVSYWIAAKNKTPSIRAAALTRFYCNHYYLFLNEASGSSPRHPYWRRLKRLIVFMFGRLLHTSHPFHCSDCGEAFKRRKDLDLHSLTHQGQAPSILITLEFKSSAFRFPVSIKPAGTRGFERPKLGFQNNKMDSSTVLRDLPGPPPVKDEGDVTQHEQRATSCHVSTGQRVLRGSGLINLS